MVQLRYTSVTFANYSNQFMHNGNIEAFSKIKRRLQQQLSDEIFNVVKGNTDSEWSFALFLSKVRRHVEEMVII
jgi:predicted glutamine amidotransferase